MSDDPPNMAGVMDMAQQLDISEENKKMMMRDMRDYINGLIADILDSMGYPEYLRDEAVAKMAYAFGS